MDIWHGIDNVPADLGDNVVTIGATRLLAHNAGAVDSADALRTMALDLRGKLGSQAAVIVLVGAELNSEAEKQTNRDTTTGRAAPMGKRDAKAADVVAL